MSSLWKIEIPRSRYHKGQGHPVECRLLDEILRSKEERHGEFTSTPLGLVLHNHRLDMKDQVEGFNSICLNFSNVLLSFDNDPSMFIRVRWFDLAEGSSPLYMIVKHELTLFCTLATGLLSAKSCHCTTILVMQSHKSSVRLMMPCYQCRLKSSSECRFEPTRRT